MLNEQLATEIMSKNFCSSLNFYFHYDVSQPVTAMVTGAPDLFVFRYLEPRASAVVSLTSEAAVAMSASLMPLVLTVIQSTDARVSVYKFRSTPPSYSIGISLGTSMTRGEGSDLDLGQFHIKLYCCP